MSLSLVMSDMCCHVTPLIFKDFATNRFADVYMQNHADQPQVLWYLLQIPASFNDVSGNLSYQWFYYFTEEEAKQAFKSDTYPNDDWMFESEWVGSVLVKYESKKEQEKEFVRAIEMLMQPRLPAVQYIRDYCEQDKSFREYFQAIVKSNLPKHYKAEALYQNLCNSNPRWGSNPQSPD